MTYDWRPKYTQRAEARRSLETWWRNRIDDSMWEQVDDETRAMNALAKSAEDFGKKE